MRINKFFKTESGKLANLVRTNYETSLFIEDFENFEEPILIWDNDYLDKYIGNFDEQVDYFKERLA